MTKEFLINVSSFLIFHLYNIILFVYSIFFKSNRPTRNFDPSLLGTTSISIADRLWNIKNSTLTVISLPNRAINFQREYEHPFTAVIHYEKASSVWLADSSGNIFIFSDSNQIQQEHSYAFLHYLSPSSSRIVVNFARKDLFKNLLFQNHYLKIFLHLLIMELHIIGMHRL